MKLWGWWRKEKGPEQPAEPEMLEDLPPKFEDNVEDKLKAQNLARPSLSKVLKSIGTDDFTSLHQMPCFRNSMLTGLGMGLTAGAVMFASRRSTSRIVNWMFGGFVVGSVVTWEQCRFRTYRGKRNMRQAQEAYRHKDDESAKEPPSTQN